MTRQDRNPLRRPRDRAGTVIGMWLLVACAAAAPFAASAAAAGPRTLAGYTQTGLTTRYEVTAITLEQAPVASYASDALFIQAWVSARWTAPDGRQRAGQIQIPDGTRPGSPERIWVTRDGAVAAPPLSATETKLLADGAAWGAVVALVFLTLIARTAIRHLINRRNLASWDAEWAAIEPIWNHQR